MPNIFLPRVSKSMTYTSLVADPGRLAGFSKSKQRLKARFALTPLIGSVCLSLAHQRLLGLLVDLFASLASWLVCLFLSLCGPDEKCSGDYLYPFGCGRTPVSPEICKIAATGQCLSQTQEGLRKHRVIGRHGPLQTPSTKGGPRCRAWGRDQGGKGDGRLLGKC